MKKNSLLSVGFIIFILIFSLGIYSYMSIKNKQEEISIKNKIEQEKKDKEIKQNLEKLEVKPIVESIEENTSSSTGDISKVSSQTQIKQEKIMILSFSNVGECDTLKYLKERCKETFLYQLATQSGDIDYCTRLKTQTEVNNCKDEIYFKKNECQLILDSYLKEKCSYNLQVVTNHQIAQKALTETKNLNTDTCKKFTSYSQKESCLKTIILKELNINLCNSFFTQPDEKKSCVVNISYDFNREIILQAFEKKDKSLCDKLMDEAGKTQCKNMSF